MNLCIITNCNNPKGFGSYGEYCAAHELKRVNRCMEKYEQENARLKEQNQEMSQTLLAVRELLLSTVFQNINVILSVVDDGLNTEGEG